MERGGFSSQISTLGPYPIKGNANFRRMKFAAIVSTGLMNYLKNAQVSRPDMKISDELNDQYFGCRSPGTFKYMICDLYNRKCLISFHFQVISLEDSNILI